MSGAANAADTLAYGPPPAWVQRLDLPANPGLGSGGIQVLLQDSQVRYGADYTERYQDIALKVLTPAALNQVGTITDSWNPATTAVTINALQVIRGGRVIDALAPDSEAGGDPFIVLRRETNLNLAVLDGALTATKQLGGLQVGDIVRFTLTERSHDPVLQDMAQDVASMNGVVSRARLRFLWSPDRQIRWRTTEGFGEPKVTRTSEGTELVMDRTDVKALVLPEGAPARFGELGQMEVSQFADWQAVSRLFSPLYRTAATLSATSPLKAQAATIRAANTTKLAQATAALKLVQEQVRYVALAMGEGGLTPSSADATWSRRFGDCKGKTALLLAVLNELGIEAKPALVNAEGADGLDQRLPNAALFNHVIVRATIDGKVYWLDGTRPGGDDLTDLPVPAFDWALPLTAQGAGLEKLVVAPPVQPMEFRTVDIDLTGGKITSAPVHVDYALSGDAALVMRLAIASTDAAQLSRALITLLNGQVADVHIDKATYTDQGGVLTVSGDGRIDIEWYTDPQTRQPVIQLGASYGYEDPPERKTGLVPDAPLALAYPLYYRRLTHVKLPGGGAGFSLNGADSDLTAGQVRITRSAKIEGGMLTLDQSMRSLASETPIAEARAAAARFKAAPTDDMFLLRAPMNLAASAASLDKAIADNPRDPAPLIERGAAANGAGRYADAIKDFDAAIALQPDNARAWRARAFSKTRVNDLNGALADAEQGLKLDPSSEWGYEYRGLVRVAMRDYAAAIEDFTAALRIAPDELDILRDRASAYAQLKQMDKAQADYLAAIRLAPDDARLRSLALISFIGPAPSGSYLDAIRKAYAGVAGYDLLVQRGDLLLGAGDEAGGLKDLGDAVALDGSKPGAYIARAGYLLRRNRAGEAARDLDAMVRVDPTAQTYMRRGDLLQSARDYAGALAAFNRAVELAPSSSDAKLRLAGLSQARGEEAQALDQLAALVKADPSYVAAYIRQADIYGGRKDYANQAIALERATSLDTRDSGSVHALAYAYERIGDFQAQLRTLDRGLAQYPTSVTLLEERCILKAQRNLQADTSLADCEAGLKSQPNSAALLAGKGLAELRLGRNQQAIADYTAALAAEPIFPEASYGRAVARQRQGDSAGAASDFAQAKRAAPQIDQAFAEYGLSR